MIPCSLNIYHGNTTIVWTLQRYVYLDEYHDTTFFFLYWYHDMVMFCETAMLLFLSVFADVRYIGNTIIMVLLWFLWTFSTTLLCFFDTYHGITMVFLNNHVNVLWYVNMVII